MDIEKILKVEHLAYQTAEGEQKIYILPDAEAVEQLLGRLRECGISDTAQMSLSAQPQIEEKPSPHDPLFDDMAARLEQIRSSTAPLSQPMAEVEQLLDKYLAVDGEQKAYVLPSSVNVEQILGSLAGLRTGEIKQSQMWRKTEVKIDNKEQAEMIEALDKRMRRLEILLDQVIGQEHSTNNEEIK